MSSPAAAVDALVTPVTEGLRDDERGSADADGQVPPRLADGVELIGEFEGSGFKRAPYIARRRDAQIVQLPKLLFQLAEQIDGRSTVDEIAERLSHAIRRGVQPSDVQMLIEERLRPLGIVAKAPDAESIEFRKVDPLMALKFRVALVPDGAVRSLTTIFRPLYHPAVVLLAVAAMLGLDGWLFFVHGVAQSVRHVLYQPALMLLLIAGVIVGTAFHEIGHATACRYGGAKPGVMGVGVYIVWPAFYTDITDAYRLGRWGRLRADTGGMYFNAIFALATAGVYAVTSFEPLLLLIVLQNFAILQQSLPLLRLDGYYILSDLTGVPDIFLRIGPVLRSLIPGRPPDRRVSELKGWVRVVVSAYVLLIVLVLVVTGLALVINLPRILATGYDSAAIRYTLIGPDFSHGQLAKGALDLIEMVFLALPAAGLAYTAARVARRTATRGMQWSSGHPGRQTILGTTCAAAIAIAAFSWWPNGEYRPLQPTERGSFVGLIGQVAALPTARPSLTPQRAQQLRGATTQLQHVRRQIAAAARNSSASSQSPNAANPNSATTGTTARPPGSTQTTPVGATGPAYPAGTSPSSTATTGPTGPTASPTTSTTPTSTTSTTPQSTTTSTTTTPTTTTTTTPTTTTNGTTTTPTTTTTSTTP